MRFWVVALLVACSSAPPVQEVPELLLRCRPASAPPTASAAAPWTVGGASVDGWLVTEIQAGHGEFARIFLEKEGVATGLEVAYVEGEAGEWSTENYRLMPAPGFEPPEALLTGSMAVLKAYQSEHGGRPFTTSAVEDPYAGLPPCEAP